MRRVVAVARPASRRAGGVAVTLTPSRYALACRRAFRSRYAYKAVYGAARAHDTDHRATNRALAIGDEAHNTLLGRRGKLHFVRYATC